MRQLSFGMDWSVYNSQMSSCEGIYDPVFPGCGLAIFAGQCTPDMNHAGRAASGFSWI